MPMLQLSHVIIILKLHTVSHASDSPSLLVGADEVLLVGADEVCIEI